MHRAIARQLRGAVLLAGVAALLTAAAVAQGAAAPPNPTPKSGFHYDSADLGLTWSTEHAKIAANPCHCFWMQGFTLDGAATLYRGIGVAAEIEHGSATNIEPGVNLSKFTFAAGPRYTWDMAALKSMKNKQHAPRLFGEALFGMAHAYNGLFPASSGQNTSTANSLSIEAGGGADLPLSRGVSVRLFQLEYARITFPNNYANIQNDYRMSFGVSYHLGHVAKQKK